jgi:hypothetical protein
MKPTRFYSKKQETKVAKAVEGKPVANSGAAPFVAGDVTTDTFLIECKTCVKEKQSFSIKKEWLEKNEKEKFMVGKSYSALAFDFGGDEQYYIINERLFKKLVKFLKQEDGVNE